MCRPPRAHRQQVRIGPELIHLASGAAPRCHCLRPGFVSMPCAASEAGTAPCALRLGHYDPTSVTELRIDSLGIVTIEGLERCGLTYPLTNGPRHNTEHEPYPKGHAPPHVKGLLPHISSGGFTSNISSFYANANALRCTALSRLSLVGNRISSVSPLASVCSTLVHLNLSNNR